MNAPAVALTLPLAPPPDLRAQVERAARGIAPLWPIATFAARSPWQYLEEQTFDAVAREQHARHGIPLYPALALARQALARGDIAAGDLRDRLHQQLARAGGALPRAAAQAFLEQAARGEAREMGRAEAAEWQQLAGRLAASGATPPPAAAPAWPPLLEATTIRYARLHVGAPEASWPLPGAEDGLFAAWRALVEDDPLLPATVRAALASCPRDRDTVLAQALHGLDAASAQALLADHLMALPGWAGLLRWQGRQAGDELAPLMELLALRLALAPALPGVTAPAAGTAPVLDALLALAAHGGFAPARFAALPDSEQAQWLALAAGFDERARERVLLEALELGYRRQLARQLAAAPAASAAAPEAQLVFCIDVRSEPLRRALEAAGPFATFGYAGFFGLPVRTRAAATAQAHAACPVILAPKAEIREIVPLPSVAERLEAAAATRSAREDTGRRLKHDPIASLALPELGGLWHGLQMAWHSLVPAAWRRGLTPAPDAPPATTIDVAPVGRHDGLPVGLTLDQQVDWTAAALRGIGLVRDFAPLVVVVGHGSRSRNNPYAAKLDCGACGGASGAFNARLLATLANLPLVRAGLRAQGIAVPASTRFVAAEHVTSLDTLEWLDLPPGEGAAGAAWQRLLAALPAVSAALRRERLAQLPPAAPGWAATATATAPAAARAQADALEAWRRASDWSETRPEWGLARNAAFIIGRRVLTAHADLGARAFLHSYDWRHDPDGSLLAGIVAGPVTVGQWINLQYYASTVAPHRHGSGSKTTQTVTAGVGVMQGNASDLLTGLPWQAVMADDRTPWHLPQRLLVLIEAPAAQVARLLAAQPGFARKVENGWLLLASLDPETHAWKDW